MNLDELTLGQIKKLKSSHDVEIRFWNRVSQDKDCFVWIADKLPSGYGRMQYHGKRILAHRLSYMLNNGSIPEGFVIHHKCENKSCIKPAHLEAIHPSMNTQKYENSRYGDGW